MWDNLEKLNYSTSKAARFALETHFFRDFTGVYFPYFFVLACLALSTGLEISHSVLYNIYLEVLNGNLLCNTATMVWRG